MKRFKLVIVVLAVLITSSTYSQTLDWAIGIGGTGFDYGVAIETDPDGNIYVCGTYRNEVDFDPSEEAEFILNSKDFEESYVVKYNNKGEFIWVRHFDATSTGKNYVKDMTIDSEGNIILVGEFTKHTDFDPSNQGGDLRASSSDGFVVKMNADGEFIWAEHMKGIGELEIHAVCIDENDNIYHTGKFWHTQNFNSGK